jgi:hypothetical protein
MPDLTKVTRIPQHLTQDQKSYPNLASNQAITSSELIVNTIHVIGNWKDQLPKNDQFREQNSQMTSFGISNKEITIGWVIFDCLCLAIGAEGLRINARSSTIEKLEIAAAPITYQIEIIIAKMGADGASNKDLSIGLFNILQTIFNEGYFNEVFAAFLASLIYWDTELYTILGKKTIISALATDGLAFTAGIEQALANFEFLVQDSVKAVAACSTN